MLSCDLLSRNIDESSTEKQMIYETTVGNNGWKQRKTVANLLHLVNIINVHLKEFK